MYKKELSKMHERVRFYSKKCDELNTKLQLIDRIDYVKMKLDEIDPGRQYKYIIKDYKHKESLEKLFQVPFGDIYDMYKTQLDERNKLCHKYTRETWWK
jgi:hypothetical protein